MAKADISSVRVLLFYFAELGGLGGVEVAVVTLAAALKQRGSAAAIVEIAPEQAPSRTLPNGIPVWTIAASSYPNRWRPRTWASFLRSTLQFQEVLRNFRPDLVHVHYPVAQCFPVIGANFLPHEWKLVVTVHNSDIRVAPFEAPALRAWQPRLFRRADALTAVSQSLLDDAIKLYGTAIKNPMVINNGVGQEWFALPLERQAEADYILFVGRLHQVKGVDLLLRSWKAVAPGFPGTQLWLAGDGPERQNLETLARELGISDRVRFLGSKRLQELPFLYRNARVVVLPSRREGLPISLLEAGACGAICIGTRTPGIPEIIEEGRTGFLVKPESTEELSSSLARVFQLTPGQAEEMRRAARDRISTQFSMRQMIDNYVRLYDAVTG
jgi:glycosyltransferase involved in cell wall biosynthesis